MQKNDDTQRMDKQETVMWDKALTASPCIPPTVGHSLFIKAIVFLLCLCFFWGETIATKTFSSGKSV